jgi:capsular exopolysaccharide synthesis family protein
MPMNLFSKVVDEQNPDLPPILKLGHSDPYYQEQFKALRAKLENIVDERKTKVVAITSAIASEGKTLSCVNLAINLATAERRKVLLIDADLRKSDLARGLGISPTPGFSEFLGGTATPKDIIFNSLFTGLSIIPGGKTIADPSVLLAAGKIRHFFETVREQYDVILLDTPPILPVADTLSIKDQVDGFIFVFRAGFTPYSMLRQALEELREANVLGVVLNGIEPKRHRYYQRYYGKYYRGTAK